MQTIRLNADPIHQILRRCGNYDHAALLMIVYDILKLSRNSVYVILKNKELKGYQEGRVWKVPKQAVIQYIKKKSGLM